MLLTVIGYYILIALVIFGLWLKTFIADSTVEKTDIISWVALIIGTSLWPLVLPLAYLELSHKISIQKN